MPRSMPIAAILRRLIETSKVETKNTNILQGERERKRELVVLETTLTAAYQRIASLQQ